MFFLRSFHVILTICIAIIFSIWLNVSLDTHTWKQSKKILQQVLTGLTEQVVRNGSINQEWIQTIQYAASANPQIGANHFRITVIDPSGVVIADNHGDPQRMDNHILRPEIKASLHSNDHIGSSRRVSRSVRLEYLYLAQSLYHNDQHLGFIRLAMPRKYIEKDLTALFFLIAIPIYILLVALCILSISIIEGKKRHAVKLNANISRHNDHLNSITDNGEQVIWQQDQSLNLSDMLNSLNEGIIAVNADETIVYINRAAESMLRIDSSTLGSKLWNRSRINIIPETVHECLEQKKELSKEFQVIHQYKELNYSLHVTPIFHKNSAHSIFGAVAIIDDTTDQQQLDGMRRKFFTNISHELKTPLSTIRAVIETMIDDADMPADQRLHFLHKADNNCNRLNTLVGDIITISRLEDLNSLQETEFLSLSKTLRECVHILRNKAEHKNISIETHMPDDPCKIEGDRELLQQVFDNLLSNAINYSPENSEINVYITDDTNHYIIRVVDNGPGIPPQSLERIFERFYRVDKARSRLVGGTGLGLSIAKHAVALHQGTISVKSEISQGCTFIVQLPKHRSQDNGANHDEPQRS